jgi:hypothetical protein
MIFPHRGALWLLTLTAFLVFGMTAFVGALDLKLGGAREVPPPFPAIPKQQFLPDGHQTVFQADSQVWMFWPFEDSYSTSGPSIFEMRDLVKSLPRGKAGSFDSGGAWLYTVLRGKEGPLLGFCHAEDRSFPLSPESNFIAYKSIARCTSDDFGESWKNREQILTSRKPKPQKAEWSGLGDHCIVWDHVKQGLVCFTMRMANCTLPRAAIPKAPWALGVNGIAARSRNRDWTAAPRRFLILRHTPAAIPPCFGTLSSSAGSWPGTDGAGSCGSPRTGT